MKFAQFQLPFSTGNYKLWSFCADKQKAVFLLWTRPHKTVRNVEQPNYVVLVVKV